MPSENRRPKDDTWTPAELNKALKGSKDDTHHSKKRKEDDGERRHHREDLNGSERRKDEEKRSHRKEEDERKVRRHRDQGDPGEKVELTEDERERLRQERRAKREGGTKEEKKSRPKESKSVKITDDDEDRKKRHRDRDEEGHRERRNKTEESQKTKDGREGDRKLDKDRERRHKEAEDREHRRRREAGDEERKQKHKEEDSSSRRRHKEEDGSDRRRHKEDEGSERRRHKEEEGSDRRRHKEDEGSERRRHKDESTKLKTKNTVDDEELERERRRQERRERHEREKQKDKESDTGTRHKDKDREKERDKEHHRRKEEKEKGESRDEKKQRSSEKHRGRDYDEEHEIKQEPKRQSSRHHQESEKELGSSHRRKDAEDEENEEDAYNYEEDFEDYDDDFEDDVDGDSDRKERRKHIDKGGEMEEVLRAIDEENNRLASISRKSNWSDSTDDDRLKESRDYSEPVQKNTSKTKSFINFVSAKQRVMSNTIAGKTRKRFEDLSKLIELDVARYEMFDLPPVQEYQIYMRTFGRSDTKQAYVQTRDDDADKDVQTEEVESLNKWTQHPPDDETAVGGEGINVQSASDVDKTSGPTDPEKLYLFLEKVGQFLFTILDEESKSSSDEEKRKDSKPKTSFSKKSFQLGMPGLLKDRHVEALSFCQSEPNFLISVHSPTVNNPQKNAEKSGSSSVDNKTKSALEKLSIICVWNISQPTYPFRICGSSMKITSVCFSPTKATLVFAGMYDGSVALWDLREPVSLHRNLVVEGEKYLIRFPTYNSAGIMESENHHSPVVAIAPVYAQVIGSQKDDSTTESSSGLSFQLSSVEERAVINFWVVAEISGTDPAGSENELGLAPGGRIKLLRSSSIVLTNPNRYLSNSEELKALDLRLNPGDLNHFYVATDAGCVVHGVRFGKGAYPHYHSSVVDSPVPITALDFSPFGLPYFLAGCQDGTLHLFHCTLERPVATWKEFLTGAILSVRWSQSRPAVFFVLDDSSAVCTFDLVENGLGPVKMDKLTTAKATVLEIGGDPNLLASGATRPAHMVIAMNNGAVEVMSLNDEMREQQPLEEEFMARYVDRY
ncbi:cytoplasmic dynein 2 intermediate chain 1-like isoform X2 [Physella acuta]|uniref:cytoplasmic dynein 2 intermediate chain 1-like isoform X2 n=1 Tax=Physella acuta TaxID=109671 RepID=UPI0027DE5A07|nr:cytoplasmic dynein 2 intermediate chain 1-like isoform X2 [Physella acuta]